MKAHPQHLVLLVGDDGVLCTPHNLPAAPGPFFTTHADSKGISAILAIAARYPHVPVTLLADHLAQDLRRDTVPRMNPFDRSKLIRRRLQLSFPQARLTASMSVKSDRRQVLLAALHESAVFDWIGWLTTQNPSNVPVVGLLPVECANIAEQLLPRSNAEWKLLVSRQQSGGFRQIVTYKGDVIFTRLTPPLPAHASPKDVADTISRDVQATRGYINRLGFNDQMALPAILLFPATYHQALRNANLALHEPLLLSPHEAARQLSLAYGPAIDDPYSDFLFALYVAGKKRLHLPLLPPDLRQAQSAAIVRQWGMRAAAALMLLALGLTGWDTSSLAATLLTRAKESSRLAAIQNELAKEQAAAAPVTEPAGRLRQALARQRIYSEPVTSPWVLLHALQQNLDRDAKLLKLDWRNDSGKSEDEILLLNVALAAAPGIDERETTVLHFQQLAQNIAKAMPDYTVDVARYPFPALPREALSNTTTSASQNHADTSADFLIQRSKR